MKIVKDGNQIKDILFDKIVGKQISQIDVESLWIDDNGDVHLENVTSIILAGGSVLGLQGSSHIDDCRVDVTLSDDIETKRSNVDEDYKRVWVYV